MYNPKTVRQICDAVSEMDHQSSDLEQQNKFLRRQLMPLWNWLVFSRQTSFFERLMFLFHADPVRLVERRRIPGLTDAINNFHEDRSGTKAKTKGA